MLPTPRQRAVLDYLIDYRLQHGGVWPTRREVARAFGIRPNAIQQHLLALERKGLILRERGKARALAYPPNPPIGV